MNGKRTGQTVSLYQGLADNVVPGKLSVPLILTDFWPGAGTTLGVYPPDRWPFAGRIGEVRLSQSVFYRGEFTPLPLLSVGPDTQFLFHLSDKSLAIPDATGIHAAKVIR